jgi:hypothetical protein
LPFESVGGRSGVGNEESGKEDVGFGGRAVDAALTAGDEAFKAMCSSNGEGLLGSDSADS